MESVYDKSPQSCEFEIIITIHFMNGEIFTQPLSIDDAEGAQMFMEWYRNPGKIKVWSWQNQLNSTTRMMHHNHIHAVDIEGYQELEGHKSRWYERVIDWLRARIFLWRA